jgi:hypothetical protein
VSQCVARSFKARASFKFAACCWWRSLAVDGGSGASRGHAPAMRRPGSRWSAVERPPTFQAGHVPRRRRAYESYALSLVAAAGRWSLLLLSAAVAGRTATCRFRPRPRPAPSRRRDRPGPESPAFLAPPMVLASRTTTRPKVSPMLWSACGRRCLHGLAGPVRRLRRPHLRLNCSSSVQPRTVLCQYWAEGGERTWLLDVKR